MKYLELGKTGLNISRMGFGGIPIQQSSQEDVTRLLAHLHKNGINFIDSARGYTISEERIGVALEGMRDDFVLATKSIARSFEEMERDIQISLKNFKTDVIDLYQIHNPSMA
ncbi:MAG: aldo/keto reductase, partial [Lachnospiraceae bacterium]|nr:aldo/keto reductase [Lachnospiraceae bacterium]